MGRTPTPLRTHRLCPHDRTRHGQGIPTTPTIRDRLLRSVSGSAPGTTPTGSGSVTDYNYTFDFDPAPWMRHAACRHHPTHLWFPERGDPVEEAKAICATCPVQQDCYNYAINIPNLVGIWGGTSGRERRQTKSSQRPIRHGTETGYNQHRRRNEPPCALCRKANTDATRNRQDRNK